jgi:hypothetical protein
MDHSVGYGGRVFENLLLVLGEILCVQTVRTV